MFRDYLSSPKVKLSRTARPLKMGPIGSPETSASNRLLLYNNPDGRPPNIDSTSKCPQDVAHMVLVVLIAFSLWFTIFCLSGPIRYKSLRDKRVVHGPSDWQSSGMWRRVFLAFRRNQLSPSSGHQSTPRGEEWSGYCDTKTRDGATSLQSHALSSTLNLRAPGFFWNCSTLIISYAALHPRSL